MPGGAPFKESVGTYSITFTETGNKGLVLNLISNLDITNIEANTNLFGNGSVPPDSHLVCQDCDPCYETAW